MTIEFDSFTTRPADQPAGSGRPGRRRALAALGASMLVAAAGGVGFGIGRSVEDDAALSPADSPDTIAPVAEAEDTDAPMANETATVDPTSEEATTAVTIAVADGDFAASGGGGWAVFGGESMTLLAERTTDTGAVLRAHLGQVWGPEIYEGDDFGYPDGWRPPAWCFESGQVRIALGGGEATGSSVIDVGAASWWTEPFNGRAVSAMILGAVDGNPYRVVFVQAPPTVTNVVVTFDDGSTDSTVPTNGVAMLAVPGAGTLPDDGPEGWIPPPTDFDVTFVEAGNGEAEATDEVIDGGRVGYNDPAYQASCSPPPPALPEPGEQPGEAAIQEQTIVDLMTAIYRDDDEQNADRFDDPTGIAEAREEVRGGGFEEAAANAEAIVEELVFTSPTEAWFRYRIETTTGTFTERYGIAVNIDGTWKITRETICQDLALAGGSCGGDTQNIRPPGS